MLFCCHVLQKAARLQYGFLPLCKVSLQQQRPSVRHVLKGELSGIKAAASYNFIFARPAWSDRGTWALYAGPGVAMGYVSDRTTYTILRYDGMREYPLKVHPADHGFMFALSGQVGLEYNFWFPLQLSVDIRPYFGFHVNDGYYSYGSKTGFYNYGLMGFIPTLSVRYRF